MQRRLESRVAVVTGGGSGIGRVTALMFVREGAKVVIADISVEGGEETVRMIKKAGGEAIFVKTDVSKAGEVEALINKTAEVYGRLDCAFNNAGIFPKEAYTAVCTEEDFDRGMSINLKGVWLCMKYEIPQMLKQKKGAIVNAASAAGMVSFPGFLVYVASKHGILGLTKTAALEYAKDGIRINAVCPGIIRAGMTLNNLTPEVEKEQAAREPIGRMGTAEEVAEAVVWLCSDAASFVIGHPMLIDGGYSIM